MDAGTPIYSNIVHFDMVLQGGGPKTGCHFLWTLR